MNDSSAQVLGADGEKLANLLDSGRLAADWRPDELGAVFRHQLSAPVEFDLQALPPGHASRLSGLAAADGLVLKSFRDLFGHPHPPMELLRMTKDFARRLRHHPDSPIPDEVASVLYFAAIACAWVRHRQRISGLDDDGLRKGFAWARLLPWMDPELADLFSQAEAAILRGGA